MAVDCRATGHVAASISQSQYLKAGSQARPGRELEHSGEDGPGGGAEGRSERARPNKNITEGNLDEVGGAAKPLNWTWRIRRCAPTDGDRARMGRDQDAVLGEDSCGVGCRIQYSALGQKAARADRIGKARLREYAIRM
jgi:hypothetical protein